jgi:pyruvate dehydrogenase E1 component alpha subunit
MFAELFGRATGYCEGKGGSMHIADPATGNLGANAIVGGSFGIAVGAALSAKVLAAEQVSVCFFGDGAANQGLFLETMNIASVWRLPCVFVCEDNQYGEYTSGRDVTAGQITQRAIALKLPVYEADGMDVLDVQKVAFAAVRQARAEAGPQFVNCETYRYYGHGMSDRERAYRSRAEEASWRTRDPLERLERHIAENYQLDVKKTSIHHDVSEEIAQAVEFAKTSPVPRPESVSTNVYAS